MKITDLRIGNFVYYNNKMESIGEVSLLSERITSKNTLGLDNRIDIIHNEENIKPIPLTKQWLLKFGFEEENHEDGLYYNLNGIFLSNEFKLCAMDSSGYNWIYLGESLKYLHQIQNLVYAISAKEIKLKDGIKIMK